MRVVAAIIGLLILLGADARAEAVACRWYMSGSDFVEWVENGEQQGARLVVRDARWQIGGLSLEGTRHAGCPTCSKGEIAGAALWFGVAANNADVSPEVVAELLRMAPFGISGEFSARLDAAPAHMGEFAGRARVIHVEARDGRSYDVIALSVGRGCLSLFGILSEKDGAETSIDRLATFVRAIDVEWYKPIPDPSFLSPPPRPEVTFPLGDAFRLRDWER